MLGDLIAEEHGKQIGIRVLPHDGPGPKVEVTFQASGKLLGFEETNLGTYVSMLRARGDGALYGEAHGVTMTKTGETATWTATGVGRFTGHGSAVSFRGSVYYQTASERLSRLNNIAAVFEYESDENGNSTGKVWEWK